jgi:hypothetical protein
LPHQLTVKQAAKIMEMTPGGLRGAILRGKLDAQKNEEGILLIKSHNLAVLHLYGSCDHFPEDTMTPTNKIALHDYLETIVHA